MPAPGNTAGAPHTRQGGWEFAAQRPRHSFQKDGCAALLLRQRRVWRAWGHYRHLERLDGFSGRSGAQYFLENFFFDSLSAVFSPGSVGSVTGVSCSSTGGAAGEAGGGAAWRGCSAASTKARRRWVRLCFKRASSCLSRFPFVLTEIISSWSIK